MSALPPPEFPLFLRLAGKRVLVVGPDRGKAALLRASGAEVTVVSPRDFRPEQLDGTRLCIVATEDESEAAAVATIARSRGVLVNAVDRPHLCDFFVPAIVERGPVRIAISTGGAAPALARHLRAMIETLVPHGYAALGAWCRGWRERVATRVPSPLRRSFWDAILDGPAADAVMKGEEGRADALLEEQLRRPGNRAASVALVCAGRGDPELLTLRAKRMIERADLILFDELVTPQVLAFARRDARRIQVGRQESSRAAVHRLLLEEVRRGNRVVRLAGESPLAFDRRFRELASLRAAGIEIEVVPGIAALPDADHGRPAEIAA
jgi:uroporphyrin-III C-methyltransferase/precorrin-2 dehydrogenase/sirohydrochlorin ferrochelatase